MTIRKSLISVEHTRIINLFTYVLHNLKWQAGTINRKRREIRWCSETKNWRNFVIRDFAGPFNNTSWAT